MFQNNNSDKSHGREFCLHLRRVRPKLPKAMEMPSPIQQALSLHWQKQEKKRATAASEERRWACRARAGPWHFSPGEPLPSVSVQQNSTTGKLDAVTLRVYEQTLVSQPQPSQLLAHGRAVPHRTPALPGLRRDCECRCTMWFLTRRTKDHF